MYAESVESERAVLNNYWRPTEDKTTDNIYVCQMDPERDSYKQEDYRTWLVKTQPNYYL